jgi:hypothetical protein
MKQFVFEMSGAVTVSATIPATSEAEARKRLGEIPELIEVFDDDVFQFDNTQAESEGWALFNDGEIQRVDVGDVFPGDDAALAFVEKRAREGSDYHRQALALHKAQGRSCSSGSGCSG